MSVESKNYDFCLKNVAQWTYKVAEGPQKCN